LTKNQGVEKIFSAEVNLVNSNNLNNYLNLNQSNEKLSEDYNSKAFQNDFKFEQAKTKID
jgi:hypothetical protein